MDVTLFIGRDGSLTFLYDDILMQALRELGPASTRRASNVEPTTDGKHWLADMSPTAGRPVTLGPFETRQEALDAEANWLLNFLVGTI
jgi:hypothetical protein